MQNSTSLAWLVGFEGTPNEIHFELTSQETIIGRGADCDLQLDDKLVSRRHAVVRLRDDGFEIEDLHSSNGTKLNEAEISKSPLKDKDRIRIGNTILQLRLEADPDATIIQPREPQETVVAIRQTVPHEIGAVECPGCGASNPQGSMVCHSCGLALPQLPENFQRTLEIFNLNRRSYRAGKISQEKYHAALARLMVQDQDGTFWMPGVESGDWYWHDGENWLLGDPPLIIPGEEEEQEPEVQLPPEQELVETTTPSGSSGNHRGVLVMWAFSALVVLVFGVYSVTELLRFGRGYSSGYSERNTFTQDSSVDSHVSETSEDAVLPDADASITSGDIIIRPYHPSSDASLSSFMAEAAYQEDQSSDLYSIYQGSFNSGTSAILVMNWCAIDQATMESNMASIHMVAALDGIVIPGETWTVEDSQEEGMFCRIFRVVAEELDPGSHQYLWTTSYDVPIFDGWDTYPPGTYLNEFNITIPGSDQSSGSIYSYSDDFSVDLGHWGGLDRDEVQIWVDGGDLHIRLNQAGISGITHFQDREFENFSLSTSAQSLGDPSGMYGIVFRYQDDQNYYSFQVTELGLFRVVRVQGDTVELIPWTESDTINGEGKTNQLALSMQGDHILAYINDQGVADLRDQSFSEGSLSLIAGTQVNMGHYHAVFKQVSIEAPE